MQRAKIDGQQHEIRFISNNAENDARHGNPGSHGRREEKKYILHCFRDVLQV